MGLALREWAWKQSDIGYGPKFLLMAMADLTADREGVFYGKRATLAKRTDMSERSVIRFWRALEKLGLIKIKNRKNLTHRITFNTGKKDYESPLGCQIVTLRGDCQSPKQNIEPKREKKKDCASYETQDDSTPPHEDGMGIPVEVQEEIPPQLTSITESGDAPQKTGGSLTMKTGKGLPPKKVISAAAIAKGETLHTGKPKTTKQAAHTLAKQWRDLVLTHHEDIQYMAPLTGKEVGQLKTFAAKAGDYAEQALAHAVEHWVDLTFHVKASAGVSKAPLQPHIGWITQYATEVVNFALTPEDEPKPVTLIAKTKPKPVIHEFVSDPEEELVSLENFDALIEDLKNGSDHK